MPVTTHVWSPSIPTPSEDAFVEPSALFAAYVFADALTASQEQEKSLVRSPPPQGVSTRSHTRSQWESNQLKRRTLSAPNGPKAGDDEIAIPPSKLLRSNTLTLGDPNAPIWKEGSAFFSNACVYCHSLPGQDHKSDCARPSPPQIREDPANQHG